jgi:hypothetical protein
MDFAKALTFPFEDEDWLKKLGIGVLITLGGALLSFILLIPLLLMILLFYGWQYEIIKRVKNDDPTPLPGWDDFGGLLKRGGTLFGALLIYQIPVVLFGCAAAIVSLLPVLGVSDENAFMAMSGAATIGVACCSCLILLYALAAGIVYIGGLIRYTDNEEFSTFFQIGDNFALVKDNIGDFGMLLLFFIVAGIGVNILSATGIGGLVAPVFQNYFTGHLVGQLAKKLASPAAPAV